MGVSPNKSRRKRTLMHISAQSALHLNQLARSGYSKRMPTRLARWLVFLAAIPLAAAIPPAAWVPARWNGTNPKNLDQLSGTPINCLLLADYTPAFVAGATPAAWSPWPS